ncbi:hypothetical protein [Amycolatopsis sp. cmx-11-51]|uniref:hypothetical protein n=1 Tax=Amycolatopsis sp. cmx-11-51 TaxID=2785797 RepID=UPI0039E47F66
MPAPGSSRGSCWSCCSPSPGPLLATRTVLHNQLDQRLDNEIAHETGKLRAFLASPDARPAGRPATVEAVLGRHLERNLPEKYETFFSGRRRHRVEAQCHRATGPARHGPEVRRRAVPRHEPGVRHGARRWSLQPRRADTVL